MVSAEEYERLTRRNKGKLSAALLKPKIGGDGSDFGRDRDAGRDAAL